MLISCNRRRRLRAISTSLGIRSSSTKMSTLGNMDSGSFMRTSEHTTSAQMAEINVPRPLAVLYALFGMKREPSRMDSWFRLLRAWNESGDVCESESFGECLVCRQSYKTDLIQTCRWTPEGHRRTHAAYPAFARDTLFFYSTTAHHDS